MKKLAFGIGVLLLLAIVLPAMAAPAQVVKDVDCRVPNAVGGLIATTGKEVATSSGNSMIVCKAQLNPLTDFFLPKLLNGTLQAWVSNVGPDLVLQKTGRQLLHQVDKSQ